MDALLRRLDDDGLVEIEGQGCPSHPRLWKNAPPTLGGLSPREPCCPCRDQPSVLLHFNFGSVAVVIVFVPIVLGAPAMLVLIPPPVLLAPATFARLAQLAAFVVCPPAVAAVLLDRLMKFVFGVLDAPLAFAGLFSVSPRHWGKPQKC
jgi:hypothetical protein